MKAQVDPWDVAKSIIENIREVQRRAERDSLRFIGLSAAFVFLRLSAASEVSVLGLRIEDLLLLRIALLPVAAYVMFLYAKSQALTREYAMGLNRHAIEYLPSLPDHVRPPDWDILRDIGSSLPRVRRGIPSLALLAMGSLLIGALVANLADSSSSHLAFAIASASLTILLIIAAFAAETLSKASMVGLAWTSR